MHRRDTRFITCERVPVFCLESECLLPIPTTGTKLDYSVSYCSRLFALVKCRGSRADFPLIRTLLGLKAGAGGRRPQWEVSTAHSPAQARTALHSRGEPSARYRVTVLSAAAPIRERAETQRG